ncbi:MAG TPA: VWA domain-containing protein [Gemmatimonadaceae bacterium]
MSSLSIFDHPWGLAVAIVLAVALGLLALHVQRVRRRRLARLGNEPVVSRLLPAGLRSSSGAWRATRLAAAGLLAGIAFAGPRWGRQATQVHIEGFDMVIAVDASLSMMATDVRPNRLELAKQEVRRLRALGVGARVGLIAFAGRSYILTPMTVDEGAVELFLDNLDPSIVGQAGSSLARAIRQGTDLLAATETGSGRALVVISDGEAFEPQSDVEEAGRRAREAGVALVTVGVGTAQGSTIPVTLDNGQRGLKTDENGAVVVSHYAPDLLRAAAEAANGTFIAAEQTDKAARVRAALTSVKAAKVISAAGAQGTPRFQWFLAPALLLLLLDSWLVDRKRRRRVGEPAAAVPAAAAALLLAMLLLPAVARADDAADAASAYQAKRYPEAVTLYRRIVAGGDRSPRMVYNLATALLAVDSTARAAELLEQVAKTNDPELRYRALFNLGLAHLKRGLVAPNPDSAGPSLDAAIQTYKQVLLLRSRDMDAKWNYELALRKKQSGGGGGGGGGGNDQSPQPKPDPDAPPKQPQPQPAGSVGQQRAEQILNSAARDERDVQARKQHEGQPASPPGGKDW